jgi:hypothetical protein
MCIEGKVIRKYEAETKSLNIKYDKYACKIMQEDRILKYLSHIFLEQKGNTIIIGTNRWKD